MSEVSTYDAVRDELAIRDLVGPFRRDRQRDAAGRHGRRLYAGRHLLDPRLDGPQRYRLHSWLSHGRHRPLGHDLPTRGSGRIVLNGDPATGTWFITEYGRYRDGMETYLGGRYRDSYVRTADGWRFSNRTFRGMWRRAEPAGEKMKVLSDYQGSSRVLCLVAGNGKPKGASRGRFSPPPFGLPDSVSLPAKPASFWLPRSPFVSF